MSNAVTGDWVQPSWSGHQYHGQTGQVINENINQAGLPFVHVDVDGDGSGDYWVGADKVDVGSNTHQGAMSDAFTGLSIYASNLADVAIPIIIAILGASILALFIKKIKQR